VKDLLTRGKAPDYRIDEQGTLWLKDRICVPSGEDIWKMILKETHDSGILFTPVAPRYIRT
jgi:hypothetical protein